MKDKQFDQIIRGKLERLEADPAPGSWELFESKLDGEETGTPDVEDRILDQVVYNKLHRLEEPYEPQHWQQLSSQLEHAFHLERTLIRYKLMELAFLLLFIFTLFNVLLPTPPDLTEPAAPQTLEEQRSKTGKAPSAQAGILPSDADRRQTEITSDSPDGRPAPDATHKTSAAEALTESGSDARPPTTGRTAASTEKNKAGGQHTTGAELSNLALPTITPGWQRRSLLTEKPLPQLEIGLLLDHINELGLTRIQSITPDPLALNAAAALPIKVQSSPHKRQLLVSMFGALEYNLIQTPADELATGQTLPAFDRYSLDYGGGVTVAMEMGRWEVETGAIYSAKVYRPRQVLYLLGNIKGYYGEGLKDIELNILQLPVNLRYHFLRHKDWRAYALAGFSVQVAFQANYYVADQNAFDDIPFLAPPGEGVWQPQESSLDRRNLSGGWFEGGTFEENGYLTGNLGLGLERYLSPRWSIFAQPTYQHSLDYFIQGLGPYQDRIHTMSIFMGLRARM